MLLEMEDMAMWTMFDFSPLIRSSVGFDRVFDLLETAARVQHAFDELRRRRFPIGAGDPSHF